MKERMWKRVNQRAMAKRKAVRFCWDKPLPEDFVERQLNDTGWAARAAVSQLKRLWPDVGPYSAGDRSCRQWSCDRLFAPALGA